MNSPSRITSFYIQRLFFVRSVQFPKIFIFFLTLFLSLFLCVLVAKKEKNGIIGFINFETEHTGQDAPGGYFMESIRSIYNIGHGPSSSHTMGPSRAAAQFKARHPEASLYRVTLFGSLAATGKGHLTDKAIIDTLAPIPAEFIWKPKKELPMHPNGIEFEALDALKKPSAKWRVYSTGGGAIKDETSGEPGSLYPLKTMDEILKWSEKHGKTFWEYVKDYEDSDFQGFLETVWSVMLEAIQRGLVHEGVLPGGLGLQRKASAYDIKSKFLSGDLRSTLRSFAYALAVSEENASGGKVVTAPTCGSCGVLPSVLHTLREIHHFHDQKIINALSTAGLIGNLVRHNASISGAEVGCAGEMGTACAMAAGAATQLLGGTPQQVEYAAEMGLEHHLGLTCDPVAGLVQIPCIERNAMAASRAIECAAYAILSDGKHRVSFDTIVETMYQTGRDLSASYRETSTAGLASAWKPKK